MIKKQQVILLLQIFVGITEQHKTWKMFCLHKTGGNESNFCQKNIKIDKHHVF